MNDEMLISILCVQQWEKCKGELRALIALQGSKLSEYKGNKVITNRKWEQLEKLVEHLVKEIEDNDLDC